MEPALDPIDFRENSRHVSPQMVKGVQVATARFLGNRARVTAELSNWQVLRESAGEIRHHTLEHLDYYLAMLERQVRAAGGEVHWARAAEQAQEIVVDIARARGVRTVVKGKSMASEEVALNHALQAHGIRALETDLGEYIIQLAGTFPSHIMVPALHLTKEGIADLFHEKLGVPVSSDPAQLTALARRRLREEFLSAEMGVTGANFLVAETGTLVLVTNEGNGRMCSTLPPIHVAIAGFDKVIPDWESLAVLLKVLARSATGQRISTYTSFITGPRRNDAENGPREFHLVLIDNGRTAILRDKKTRETLKCIRCGACLNICPVYNQVGGHAYGWVYSGPIGAILSPQILGAKIGRDLPFASTLCGACADICPVKIPIPEILLYLRHRVVEGDRREKAVTPALARAGMRLGVFALESLSLYRFGAQIVRQLQRPFQKGRWLLHLPTPLSRWTAIRPFPAFQPRFRAWWKQKRMRHHAT